MGNFQETEVWRKAHQLTLEIYRLTRNFPREEQVGITSQIRRATVSIELNIAEGAGRKTDGDFGRDSVTRDLSANPHVLTSN